MKKVLLEDLQRGVRERQHQVGDTFDLVFAATEDGNGGKFQGKLEQLSRSGKFATFRIGSKRRRINLETGLTAYGNKVLSIRKAAESIPYRKLFLRQKLTEIVNAVRYAGKRYVVTERGKPICQVLPVSN